MKLHCIKKLFSSNKLSPTLKEIKNNLKNFPFSSTTITDLNDDEQRLIQEMRPALTSTQSDLQMR